ncbi:PRD domain-containing protein [Amphibacillus sp. Q70]|uniref:PRD domain-containing protein n=1 Tax=Amphibacillus sp. Q70 TaxID=3453416 RepID=UPI003F85F075
MRITKVLNNNLVAVIEEGGKEVILSGPGVGFKKKPGNKVELEKVKQRYVIQNEQRQQLYSLLEATPLEHLILAKEIFETIIPNKQSNNSGMQFLALADHITFALEREKNNISLKNLLLGEIKILYPKEFELGYKATQLINQRLGTHFNEDEAGFITFHIINFLSSDTENDARLIAEFTQSTIEIFRNLFHIKIPTNSLDYQRLLIHLKHFSLNFKEKVLSKDDAPTEILDILIKENVKLSKFISIMNDYCKEIFGREMDKEEQTYLAVHVTRILKNLN